MSGGFFSESLLTVKTHKSVIPKCGACGAFRSCTTPKMEVRGEGRKRFLVVYTSPSSRDDKEDTRLKDRAGSYIRRELKKNGIRLDRDCWITYALICHSEEHGKDNVQHCQPNLLNTIRDLQPNCILLIGQKPCQSLLDHLWKDDESGVNEIERWVGWTIPSQKINAWVCPTFDPATFLNTKNSILHERKFSQHVEEACKLTKGKPWKTIPDYASQIELVHSPSKAYAIIKSMLDYEEPSAFDYEANTLKPERKGAQLKTCSICWGGERTIAFPLVGRSIEATKLYLKSRSPKIASNLKFETRWSKRHFKVTPRNWFWDTMVAAHVIDNRKGITSLKFQCFVLFGMESYDQHIGRFFKDTDANNLNGIDNIDLNQLLIYNGIDALLEYLVAMKQYPQFKKVKNGK